MNRFIAVFIAVCLLAGCTETKNNNRFTLTGTVKNLPDQQVYLEQLYFSEQKDPEVLDTAAVKGGTFTVNALAPQQGLFRLRFEKEKTVFVFINDKPELTLSADNANLSIKTVNVNSPATNLLKNFIAETDNQLTWLYNRGEELSKMEKVPGTDSMYNARVSEYRAKAETYQQFVINYIDTSSNAIVTLFALGYTGKMSPLLLQKPINGMAKRFPANEDVQSVVKRFNAMLQQKKEEQAASQNAANVPGPGDMAPDITMPDTDGHMFSLSSLRGKYVLVDFWASWCGPCREENPNVVNAFNKYKNKNFTVLGVSLDKNKEAWIGAIKNDNLNWKHISDLKHWSSGAVNLYRFEGIPYNVLVDPQGKIIATSLRGAELDTRLAEVLK